MPMDRMRPLTGLRAVAALAVLLYHADYMHGYQSSGSFHVPGLRFGWIAVDLFFVLSGFLMGVVYHRLLRRPAGGAAWHYLRDRMLRIAPAYYVSIPLALAAVGNLAYLVQEPDRVALHLAYAHIFWAGTANDISPIYWTLAIEAHFYLMLPLLLPLLTGRWRWPALAAAVAISLATRGLLYEHASFGYFAIVSLPAFLGHFALGLVGASLHREGRLAFLERNNTLWVLAGTALVVAPLVALVPWPSPWQAWETRTANVVARPLAAVGLLLILLASLRPASAAGRLLSLRGLEWVGDRSYSLYLLHVPAAVVLYYAFPPETLAWPAFFAATLALGLAVAHLLHAAVEGPALRARDWLRARQHAAPPPSNASG